jgi:hypothetical protein
VAIDVLAMRLVLAFDADNGDIYAATLQEFIGCQSCCAAVITTLITVLVTLSDERDSAWSPLVFGRQSSGPLSAGTLRS